MYRSTPRQRIDKMWRDWQLRSQKNAESFFGGSAQAIDTVADYNEYPNGAPPYLDVSLYYSPGLLGSELIRFAYAQLSSTMPADGLFQEYTIRDVMSTT